MMCYLLKLLQGLALFLISIHAQGPCGGRLCLEYASGLVHEDGSDIYTFVQTAKYDFVIEWSYTSENPSEKLSEITLKHDNDVLASGNSERFHSVATNIRSTTGRYSAYFTDRKTYVFMLHSLNKKYASGLYTITAYFKYGAEDEQFEKLNFNFGLKVNGGYTPWTEFNKCKQCGVGQITRQRTCTNPRPDFGGLDCKHLGPNVDHFPCKKEDCTSGMSNRLQDIRLLSSIENGLSVLNMLEFGSHCFITPSVSINGGNRFFLVSDNIGSRDLLKEIYGLTKKSTQVYLHCSKFPCAANMCRGAKFMTKEVQKGNVNLFDIRLSVDFEE